MKKQFRVLMTACILLISVALAGCSDDSTEKVLVKERLKLQLG